MEIYYNKNFNFNCSKKNNYTDIKYIGNIINPKIWIQSLSQEHHRA